MTLLLQCRAEMAPPKKNVFPLLFLFILLCLSTLFLLSLSPSNPKSQIHTQFIPNPHSNRSPNFTLIIKVLTFNRLSSLSRCLNSLARAQYDGDVKVHLHIYVDHFVLNESGGPADLDQRLNLSAKTLDFIDGFDWKFGEKLVHYRTSNAGLQAQWLEAWWPASDHEFAFVVEDDLEVSPLYYRFLKSVILNYYYNASNFSPMIYGASLQRPRFVPGKHGNKIQLDTGTRVFLYQLVGTWGQLLFPRPWKEFRLWYDVHKAKGIKPFLGGMVTTGWYKKMGERIWTPWFIKFIHSRGYFNIYTNFSHERALSISHRDAGVNYGRTAGPDSYLLDENSADSNSLELHPLSRMKWYDFCFREVLLNRIVRNLDELGDVLQSVQKNRVVLVSLFQSSEIVIKNLLCHFERLNIRDYIFVGPRSHFLLDLARRGHPVIDANQLFENMKPSKPKKLQESSVEPMKETWITAHVIRKCLELSYNTWLLYGNMVPLSSDSFLNSFGSASEFYVGKSSRILCVRSSSSVLKIWVDDFIYEIVSAADNLRTKDSISWDGNFPSAVQKLLEKRSIKFENIDLPFGIDINGMNDSQTSPGNENKFTFWPSRMDIKIVQKQLEQLGLWVLDSDSTCSAVVCHPS